VPQMVRESGSPTSGGNAGTCAASPV
jgi:hypothetical protein